MEQLKKNVVLFLILFGIPILGYLTSLYVASNYESQFKQALVPSQMSEHEYINQGITYLNVCGKNGVLGTNPEYAEVCSFADEIYLTRQIVLGTAALGLFLLVLIFSAKYISGTNRQRLAMVFGPAVRIIMIVLALSVIAQAGLFIYSIYTLETAAIQRVHAGVLIAVAIAAVVACFKLLAAGFSYFKNSPTWLRAIEVSKRDYPELIALIQNISSNLQSDSPDNVVVGLEPTFFVTTNDVELAGAKDILKGRTLFLSLSLMRILNRDELTAVIGHELGHFRGEDTAYSLRFAPIYTKLSTSLNEMQANEDIGAIATLPAQAVLGLCLEQFASVERTIGRERELIADKAGAEAASPHALACALVKVSLYTNRWNALTRHHIDILSEGNFFVNLAISYRSVCESAYSELNWNEARSALGQYIQAHPIDTHPPMQERLSALGFPISTIDVTISKPAEEPSSNLIPQANSVEEELTILEINYLQAIGAVMVPDGNP